MDIWLSLLWNSFTAHVLLSPNSESLLYAFAAFLREDWMMALVLATIAGTLANFSSYVIGFYLTTFKDKKWFLLDDIQYETIQRIMRRYGVFILLLQSFPLYSLLPLIMGFFRVKPLHVVVLMAIGMAVNHTMGMQELMELMAQ